MQLVKRTAFNVTAYLKREVNNGDLFTTVANVKNKALMHLMELRIAQLKLRIAQRTVNEGISSHFCNLIPLTLSLQQCYIFVLSLV